MGALAPGVRALAYALLPVALVLAHRNVGLSAALIGLTGLAGLANLAGPASAENRAGRAAVPRPAPLPPWAWPFLGLVAWLSLTTLWTPNANDASWSWRLPLLVLAGVACVRAADGARSWEGAAFAGAVLLGVLLLGTEGLTGGAVRDALPPTERPDKDDVASARGVGAAILLLPPALLCLRRQGLGAHGLLVAGGVGAVCLALGVWRFGVIANGLALALAGLAGLCAWYAPRSVPRLLLIGGAAALLLAPLAALALPPPETIETLAVGPLSWRQRLLAWRLTADAATSGPLTLLFGAGQNASSVLGEALGTARFPGAPIPIARLPSHPHDMPLQLWYEGGLVALWLGAAGLALAARAAGRWPRDQAAAASALAAAFLVLALVDADLWSAWRWSVLALAVTGLRLAAPSRKGVVNVSPKR